MPEETPQGGELEEAALDPELEQRISALVSQLVADDPAGWAEAEAALREIGSPAAARLEFSLTDSRLSLAGRMRAGTLLGNIGDRRFSDPDLIGPLMEVPGGPFLMGGLPGEPEAETNALPQHEVEVATFWMTRYTVTNQAFRLFVEDGGYARHEYWLEEGWAWRERRQIDAPHYWEKAVDLPNHPVVGVSWFEAMAYVSWLNARQTARGELKSAEVIRLPTEAEWEKAGRGGTTLDRRRARPNPMPGRRYPWGDAFLATMCNTAESQIGRTNPVGMYADAESPYKIEGLAGNVLEWCSSRPVAYPYNAHDGRELLGGGERTYRIARGGAWTFNGGAARCAYRHWNHPDFRGNMIGLRIVRGRAVV